jgi:predicted DNA-binding transcriptional regulator AlpA
MRRAKAACATSSRRPGTAGIGGLRYFTASEVVEQLGVSRQTLWRWRQDGKIPSGHRFRNRHVVFTPAEVKEIEHFATRIDPIEPADNVQGDLFKNG